MKKIIVLIISIIVVLGILGASFINKLPGELTDFTKITKGLFSAIEVGLNYEQYQDMLVNLNISANNAIEKLNKNPGIQEKIRKIVDVFKDARGLWYLDIRTKGVWILDVNSQEMRKLFQPYLDKYPFLIEKAVETKYDYGIKSTVFSPMLACKLLWKEAAKDFSTLERYSSSGR